MRSWCSCLWLFVLICAVPALRANAGGFSGPHPGWTTAKAMPAGVASDRLLNSTLPLLDDGSARLQAARASGERAPATVRALALMVAFADTCFYGSPDDDDGALPNSTQSEFLYAAHDSSFYAHLLQNVADYYTAASGGRFTFEPTVYGVTVALAEGMAHYGDDPEAGEQPILLAQDVIAAIDAEVDFSLYDTVILIHAGAGEETDGNGDSPEQIYSAYLGYEDFAAAVADSLLDEPFLPTDDHAAGDGVRHVLVLPECEYQDPGPASSGYYGSLGVYCFELGLRLGMLSLFDFTDNDSQGIGQFGLMGFGLWSAGGLVPPQPCAFNKQLMGWLEPLAVDVDAAAVWTLDPAAEVGGPRAAARVDLTGAEYYLIEYRLQDPDGNNRFSFDAGDLNHNGVPDFYDADAPGGIPASYFDPATDTPERFLGAEWDFFLSDNAARTGPYKAAGSGLLIWHIDEGVIRGVWDAERNLFNADPARKSVDLEEADGIQDLDQRQGTAYWLGADVDTWKHEGHDTFGPQTRPDTRTNGGVATGLLIDGIAAVVVDSVHVYNAGAEDEYTGILFSPTMSFRCAHANQPGGPPALIVRDLPGVDLGTSHLRAARLAESDLGFTVVAVADSGRVYAFGTDLAEAVDHDADPATFAPLCTGTDLDGEPVAWLGSAALGRFEAGDMDLDLVIAAAGGLYAFRHDGTPVMTGGVPGTAVGLVAPLDVVTLPAVLLPGTADGVMVACVGTVDPNVDGAPTQLRFLDATGTEVRDAVALPGQAASVPVLVDDRLLVPVVGHAGDGLLTAVAWPASGQPAILWTVALDLVPGDRPLTVTDRTALVSDDAGRVQTVSRVDGTPRLDPPWNQEFRITSTVGAGGAVLAPGRFGRLGEGGAWQTGWPVAPTVAAETAGAEPLALGDPGDPGAFLFGTRDGRLYLVAADGTVAPGWPVAGPADLVGTPIVAAEPGAEGRVSIVVAGVTPQVAGTDPDVDGLLTRPVTRLRAWTLELAADRQPAAGVAQYGGTAAGRAAVRPLVAARDLADADELARSHVCYPQPLRGRALKVRGLVAADGRARAVIYNLEGEVVRDTGEEPVLGGAPFELEVDLDGVASGLYLCKLVAGGQTSVKTIAVAR
ncbi:MAG: hypothetical protein R3D98_08635 [Candidatus Krumholzibacteriia bacterium]